MRQRCERKQWKFERWLGSRPRFQLFAQLVVANRSEPLQQAGFPFEQQIPVQSLPWNFAVLRSGCKKPHLLASLWLEDTTDEFDTIGADNAGYTKRKALTANSSEVDMMGKLHMDMCFLQRDFINGIDIVKCRLIRTKDTFSLVSDGQYQVKLKDIAAFSRKVRPTDAVRL